MLTKAAIAVVALAGHVAVEAVSLQKRDGGAHGHGGGHGHAAAAAAPSSSYGAPAQSYSPPAQSYAAPADTYGAPASSYAAPASTYGAPAPSYGTPSTGYDTPATGYGETGAAPVGPDLITPIVIGILALVGLSLLFPTFVSVAASRKKRSTGEEADPSTDILDRVNDIYSAVFESEECMRRIACELGGISDNKSSRYYKKMASGFVPRKYKEHYNAFMTGKDCQKIECGSFSF